VRVPGATLYLVPTSLGGMPVTAVVPPATLEVIRSLECFIAENARTARSFLKAVGHPRALQALRIETLDEHTPESRLAELLRPLLEGKDCGLMSEAGCPGVADPGAALVRDAHAAGVKIVPLVGPSALLLALMASGMNGQRFAFHGYLPVERTARAKKLLELETESEKRDVTQLFIEAPYRNDALFEAIVETCRGDTSLCVACDLTLPSESVRTRAVSQWRVDRPPLDRRPTVFLLHRTRARRAQKR